MSKTFSSRAAPAKVVAVFRHGDTILTLHATIAEIAAFLRLWSTSGRVIDAVRAYGRVQ